MEINVQNMLTVYYTALERQCNGIDLKGAYLKHVFLFLYNLDMVVTRIKVKWIFSKILLFFDYLCEI